MNSRYQLTSIPKTLTNTVSKSIMLALTAGLWLATNTLAADQTDMSHPQDEHKHNDSTHNHADSNETAATATEAATPETTTQEATTPEATTPATATTSADNKIVITVSGMVCDFCARGIEKSFDKEGSTEQVVVNLAEGLVTVVVKAEASISDATITTLITDNGISVNNIQR